MDETRKPGYWRDRADEARAIAETFRDPEARRLMLEIAERYERMVARIQTRPPPTKDGEAQGS